MILERNQQLSDTPEDDVEPTGQRRRRLMLIPIVLALLIGAGALFWYARSSAQVIAQSPTAPIIQADLTVQVESSGTVKPSSSIDLAFQRSGQVAEVFVKPNQVVQAGQKLAQLDDKQLRLAVQQAEADVQTAKARLQQAEQGSSTAAQIEENRAAVQQAQAELTKARASGPADIREAEAALRAAQARLDAALNPSAEKINTAQSALDNAQRNLSRTRDSLSAAKTNGQLALERATTTLVQAQSSYATAKTNWEHVEADGTDPLNPSVTDASGKARPNRLSDAQRQQYYDAFVQAEAALRSAEKAVSQAQLDYDTARQNEVSGVQQAEADLAAAQRDLEVARNPSASAVAQARADVQQAQARLDRLRQGSTAADLSAAQARVEQAQARLAQLTSPSSASDISIAGAALAQAEAKLTAAKLDLDSAVLTAPISGTLTAVNVVPGSTVSSGPGSAPSFSIANLSSLFVNVSVSESDIARVAVDQDVTLTFDALPDQTFKGSVTSVSPVATEQNNVVTYLVTVQFDPGSSGVKIGMTANASITVERRPNVIQVPNRAISSEGPFKTVEILYGATKERVKVKVETGTTNGTTTEIVRCVDTQNQCLRAGDQVVLPGVVSDEGGNAQQQDSLIQVGDSNERPSGPPQVRPLP
ncbi:MAG: efflux RND transporter periplasmic adaptor subunit [Roseiflexaceae bacterium]